MESHPRVLEHLMRLGTPRGGDHSGPCRGFLRRQRPLSSLLLCALCGLPFWGLLWLDKGATARGPKVLCQQCLLLLVGAKTDSTPEGSGVVNDEAWRKLLPQVSAFNIHLKPMVKAMNKLQNCLCKPCVKGA